MKKQTTISKWKLLITLLLLLTAGQCYSQSDYNCSIDNIVYPTPSTLEFDIMIANTGTTNLQLQTFQMGLEFNYTDMANGGTITSSWVPGSSTALLPAGFQDLTAQAANPMGASLVTSGYRQIRLTAKTGVGSSNGIVIPSTYTKYATMRLTHSATFPLSVTPNFIWSFHLASGRTKTNFSANVNGNPLGTILTTQVAGSGGTPHAIAPSAPYSYIAGPQHFVNGNPAPPLICPTAAIGTVVNALCFGGNGSAEVLLSPASDGSYTLDAGAPVAFATATTITVTAAQGTHTLVVNPSGCTTPTFLNFTIGGPASIATNTTNATACDTYTWSLNATTYTQSGTYTGSSIDGNGCTVNEVLNLTLNASTSNTTNATACDTYTWSVNVTTYTQSGTYIVSSINAAGCPNTEILNLTINESTSNTTNATACDTYAWSANGNTYTQSGMYTSTSTNAAGCTHTATLNLTINASTSSSMSATACDTYTWSANSNTYAQSGTYTSTSTNAAGCPNTETLNLTINNSTSNITNAAACDAYTWMVNGTTYTQSGTYTSTSLNAAGCIHTETLNLTINASTSSSMSVTACDTYTWSANGTTYSQSGTYTATSFNAAGCTHTATLNLTINASTSSSMSATACDTYTWSANSNTYAQSGTYTSTSTNAAGCPNTETLNLTINNSTSNITNAAACDAYTWMVNGATYTQSGTYTSTSLNAVGCAHTETLNLTINASTSSSMFVTACDTYTWSANGTTYSQSGTYTATSFNAAGCTHTATLNLTINASTSSSMSATACDTYTWALNGITYTQSGIYTSASLNPAGCANTAMLNLTINASTASTITATACNTYTWSVNGITYTQSGTYTLTSLNAAGCTHTTTLNLTVNVSTLSTTNATACGTYTWAVNGITYTQSGTYTFTSLNAAGCSHISTLNLTINASTTSSMSANACDTYTWAVNGTTYTMSGTYTSTSLNSSGCLQTQILILTIKNSTSSTTSATACGAYTWACNGMTYNVSGTYTCTYTNSVGCTHTATLNLTINNLTLTCPASAVRFTNSGLCTYQIQGAEFNATTNNCSVASLSYVLSGATVGSGSGSMQSLGNVTLKRGITAVTWTATSASSNTVSCSFTVEVKDDQNSTNYIIYAKDKVEFGESNFIGGDVGVTNANGVAKFKKNTVLDPFMVKAQNIDVDLPSTVNNRVYNAATGGPTPAFIAYNGSTTGLSNLSVTSNGVVSGNYKDLNIKKAVTCTVTGNNFGHIVIEEGAKVTFTSSILNIVKFEVKKGKKLPFVPTVVIYSNPSTVKVKDNVIIEDDCRVNVNGPKVTYYVGDGIGGTGNFEVRGENSQVNGNVVIPKGELKVKGGSDATRITVMTGWYVIEKLKSEEKYVYWNKYLCGVGNKNIEELVTEVAKEEVNVYPNPTSGELNVGFTVHELTTTMVKVLDMSGRIVKQIQYTAEEGLNTVTMNISDLNTGVYTLQLSSKDKVMQVTRVVKN